MHQSAKYRTTASGRPAGSGSNNSRSTPSGANPSYIARQLGHTKANMLFRVYSKWIDGTDKSRERDKLNVGFGHRIDCGSEEISAIKYLLAEREGFEPSIQVLARMLP